MGLTCRMPGIEADMNAAMHESSFKSGLSVSQETEQVVGRVLQEYKQFLLFDLDAYIRL